jgi:hypothetical protein
MARPLAAIKVCSRCGVAKALPEFHRRTRSPDGHQAHCKACGRAALDAADARARARQRGVFVSREEVEDAIATEAETVVDVLFACALEGHADVLDRLAEALHPDCPTMVEGYDGADCLLHELGRLHIDQLRDRVPDALRAMDPAWQAFYAPDSGDDREGAEGAP